MFFYQPNLLFIRPATNCSLLLLKQLNLMLMFISRIKISYEGGKIFGKACSTTFSIYYLLLLFILLEFFFVCYLALCSFHCFVICHLVIYTFCSFCRSVTRPLVIHCSVIHRSVIPRLISRRSITESKVRQHPRMVLGSDSGILSVTSA
jgi:hypothetical protein